MKNGFRFYKKLVSLSFRSQLEYKASFLMLSIANFLATFVDIAAIWILIDRFKMVKGWSFPELMLIFGTVQMGFAIGESTTRGFDTFSKHVNSGDFDRVLLRPVNTLLQIAAQEVTLMRVGRFLQGLVILILGWNQLHFSLFSFAPCIILMAILGCSCFFAALFVLQATLSFWTIESLEVMNIATYGGRDAGQYPMSLYKAPFRLFFTCIIPLSLVTYYPLATLLHHESFPIYCGCLFPLSGLLFLFCACKLWHVGVCHYCSTGN